MEGQDISLEVQQNEDTRSLIASTQEDQQEEVKAKPIDVVETRIKNEIKLLDQQSQFQDYRYNPQTRLLTFPLPSYSTTITLNLSKQTMFPFMPPTISIVNQSDDFISLFDLSQATFEDVMREHWHPSLKIVDILERTVEFVGRNVVKMTGGSVPGKVVKKVHGKGAWEVVKGIIGIKIVSMIIFTLLGTASEEIKVVENLYKYQITELYDTQASMEVPLAIYLKKLVGSYLALFTSDFNSLLSHFIFNLFKGLLEILLLYPSLLFTMQRLHPQYHGTIRLSLLTLTLLLVATLNLDLITVPYLALLLPSLVLLIPDKNDTSTVQCEISAVLFGLCNGLNPLNVWLMPLYTVMQMYALVVGSSTLNMDGVNKIVTRLSQTGMIYMMVSGMPWIELITSDQGFNLVEKVFFRIYLENFSDLPSLLSTQTLSGNIWSLLPAPTNGNFISLLLYGLLLLLLLLKLRRNGSHSLTIDHLFLTLSISLFLPLSLLHLTPASSSHISLVLLSLTASVNQRPYLNLLQVLFTIRSSNILLVAAWQYLSMNFGQTVEALRTREKKGDDEEDRKKTAVKGINWYFRVQQPTKQMREEIVFDGGRYMWIMHIAASGIAIGNAIVGRREEFKMIADYLMITLISLIAIELNRPQKIQVQTEEHSHKPGEQCTCSGGISTPLKTKSS